jgi:hypothetical protein
MVSGGDLSLLLPFLCLIRPFVNVLQLSAVILTSNDRTAQVSNDSIKEHTPTNTNALQRSERKSSPPTAPTPTTSCWSTTASSAHLPCNTQAPTTKSV